MWIDNHGREFATAWDGIREVWGDKGAPDEFVTWLNETYDVLEAIAIADNESEMREYECAIDYFMEKYIDHLDRIYEKQTEFDFQGVHFVKRG